MKIFVNARFLTQAISGVQRYGIECSRQIKKLHPEVTFVAPKNVLHKDIANELNVNIIGMNTGHLWEQADLPFYLAKKGYPPLINLANTAPVFYSNSYVTIHDLAFYHHPEWNTKKFSTWYNILIPRIAYSCKHIFTVSNTIRGEIMRCYNISPGKISVAYNGISQKMLSYGPHSSGAKERIILSVGTFSIRKNHSALIKAFLNSKAHDVYTLVIVGDKNKVFRDNAIDETAISDNHIKIYDTLSEDELINMFRKAEIIASASLYEGFGIPVLEGLYNGCKALCSDIPVYRELYDGYAAFCNPRDDNSMVEAMDSIITQPVGEGREINDLLKKCSYKNSAQIILDKVLNGKKK